MAENILKLNRKVNWVQYWSGFGACLRKNLRGQRIDMKIEHIAIWAEDIDLLRGFYCKYFNMESGCKYVNSAKKFTSYFLSFGGGKPRIELMNVPDMGSSSNSGNLKGLAHFAISVGSREMVDGLTAQLRADGYKILGEPRVTGDGYYESAVADPEGNYVEITE